MPDMSVLRENMISDGRSRRLCRERFGREAFLLGFGTDHGTVAAARDWDAPMQVMVVRPSHAESYERLFHESGVPALLLPLGPAAGPEAREELRPPRLERAIGVTYRPETELQSHYCQAVLPVQFDEYVWFDETRAVRALPAPAREGGAGHLPVRRVIGSLPLREIAAVQARLAWMREARIWPNGLRYLWTDAFGVVLLVSLWQELHDDRFLRECKWVVAEVERVLGRPRGIRIGEEPDRDGQYFHYLAMWIFALDRLGVIDSRYREKAIALVRDIHPAFVVPGTGVIWKMREDLSGPYPGFGVGALDAFHGLVVYRLLDPSGLAPEIAEMKALVEATYPALTITQDLGLGMMLWMSHFFPDEPWAVVHRARTLAMLDRMWVDPPGYFGREPSHRQVKFAFTNYGVSLGLQAACAHGDRVRRLNTFFDSYRSGDEYDTNAITHVMACTSHFPGRFLRPVGAMG